MVHVPIRELRQFIQEAVYFFAVGDTDVVRVFCRRAVFVSTDCDAGSVALAVESASVDTGVSMKMTLRLSVTRPVLLP